MHYRNPSSGTFHSRTSPKLYLRPTKKPCRNDLVLNSRHWIFQQHEVLWAPCRRSLWLNTLTKLKVCFSVKRTAISHPRRRSGSRPLCCRVPKIVRVSRLLRTATNSALLTLLHNAANDRLAPFMSNETLGSGTTTASCATRLSCPETKCKSVC